MQHQPNINGDNDDLHQQHQQHNKRAQEDLSSLLIMQTRRRQKTLSSISNFVPLHILLNQPRGVSFSLTVPKSFTIEQLARQIEAEYAYLVEREVGHSRFPVIECGALFDHVELPRRRSRRGRPSQVHGSRTSGSRKPSQDYCEDDDEEFEDDGDEGEEDEDDEEEEESEVDERDEAESRGVQLRFSDRVEDVLERDSTVHVVNIDQGLARGRKLSLTNLAAMAVSSSTSQDSLHHPTDSAGPSSPPPSSSMSHLSPHISSNSLSLLQIPHQHSQQQQQHVPQRLSSPISFGPESDVLSVHSSVLATAASTPFQSPLSLSDASGGSGGVQEFSPTSISISKQQPFSTVRRLSNSQGGATPSALNLKEGDVTAITTTATTHPSTLALASPYVSSNSISTSSYLGADLSPQAATINTTAATITDGGAPTPTAATTPTTIATNSSSATFSSSSSFRPRSRATDLLLNLETSSNDARFQEILHNTIALDLFRQFCFQEYSIENLLFWMDVELFAKPNLEMQRAGRLKHKILQRRLEMQQRVYRQQQQQLGSNRSENKESQLEEKREIGQGEDGTLDEKEKFEVSEHEIEKLRLEVEEEDAQFAVQHARYIYLTYIDSNAPLQVNLSDESRTDIPWPILDAGDNDTNNSSSHSRNNSGASKDGMTGICNGNGSRTEEVVGWPLDRHMFDGAQEHTYQLMKGHTLVRFEDSELWKSARRMMLEQPSEYEKATVHGPLHSHYCPDTSVILSTVARSRSRHPTAKLQTLYNWNNSTTDLNRSRDKEEALAKTMSQYFGPIPPSIRHPGRVILGLGPRRRSRGAGREDELEDYDDDEDEFDDFDTFEDHVHGALGPLPTTMTTASMMTESKRSSAGSAGSLGDGLRKNRFAKRLSGGIGGRGKNGQQHHSNGSDELVSGDLNEDSFSMDHHDFSHDGIDSVANGRRTTRWMVAGYFNDQVRLTAAQRKRLLRRNNKLTKFFGSRVDGTLRPVEETENGGFIVPPSSRSSAAGKSGSLAAVGAGGVPMLGSPLAYALSSSTIHDMDRNGRPKKNKSKRDSGNDHEVLFHFPGGTKSGGGSRSMNILQKFKRNSGEYYDSNTTTRSSLFLNTTSRKSGGSQDDFGVGSSNRNNSSNSRHFRSVTSVDTPPGGRRILAAHPHPLWSGSLSDREVDSPSTYERRRQLSILSIMGNGLYNSSTSPQSPHPAGLTPTTPTELFASPQSMAPDGSINKPSHTTAGGGGGSSDRQAMSSRKKKADKLSTFFGAQLTAQELSSQLRMEEDFNLLPPTSRQSTSQRQEKKKSEQQEQYPIQRSLSESDKHKIKSGGVVGPTVLSVNQLSHRDRTLLWKRNKKLRGILGESLQESEVALSLTIPVLMGSSARLRNSMSTSRRSNVGNHSLRKRRHVASSTAAAGSSLHGKHLSTESRTGDDEHDEEEEGEGEDDSEGYEDLNSSSNLVRPKINKSSSTKARARRSSNTATTPVSARARRSSVTSNASSIYRRYPRSGRGSSSISGQGLNRAVSVQSLDSFLTVDTVLDEVDLEDEDDLRKTEEELGIPRHAHRRRTSSIRPYGYSHLSPRYRQIHISAAAAAALSSTNGDGTATTTAAAAAAERFNRKKKMDKIQQFLGDRVPEQDLWMGTVGREKTQEMLEKNMLSSANGAQGGISGSGAVGTGLSRSATGARLTPKFKKATFPGRGKTTSDNNATYKSESLSEKETGESSQSIGGSVKKTKPQPVILNVGSRSTGGIRMERSLSDPPRLEDGSGNGLGIRSPGVHQPPYQWHTTASRLRQQLASPDLPTPAAGAGGVNAIGAPVSETSPPVSLPTSFSPSSAASPRHSSSSSIHPIITTSTATNSSPKTTVDASTSPNLPTNPSSPRLLTVLYDEDADDSLSAGVDTNDDESAQILPRLRAMSGKDQERFLKRAEKLERLFGHFPPSALLQSSLTTTSSSTSSFSGASESKATDSAGAQGVHHASRSSGSEDRVSPTTAASRGGETSMVQLAAFLAAATTQDRTPLASSPSVSTSPTSPTPSPNPQLIKKKSTKGEGEKWISETMEALAEVERTAVGSRRASASANCSEGVVESLVISPV